MKKLPIIALLLFLPLGLTAEKLGTLTEVLRPGYIDLDREKIVVSEGSVFYVFSTRDLSFIRKFGKKGSGPGELVDAGFIPNPITIIPGGYFAEGIQKLIFFDPGGNLVREIRKQGNLIQTLPLGENFVVLRVAPPAEGDEGKVMMELCIYDGELNFNKVLTRTAFGQQGQPPEVSMVPDSIFYDVESDRLFVEESHRGFVISVFDTKGQKLYEITKDSPPLPVTAADKERILEDFKNDPLVTAQTKGAGGWDNFRKLITMRYPRIFPPLREMNVSDGKVYVTTYQTDGDREKCIVMDLKGQVLKKTFIMKTPKSSFLARLMGKKTRLYQIVNDTVYYLHENLEDEEWEIHTYRIE